MSDYRVSYLYFYRHFHSRLWLIPAPTNRTIPSSIKAEFHKLLYTSLLDHLKHVRRDSYVFNACKLPWEINFIFHKEGYALILQESPPLQFIQPEISAISNKTKNVYLEYRVDILAHVFFRDLCCKCTFNFEASFVVWLLLCISSNSSGNPSTSWLLQNSQNNWITEVEWFSGNRN